MSRTDEDSTQDDHTGEHPALVTFDDFAGSQSCAECHQDKWNDYLTSGHSQTFYKAGEGPFAKEFARRTFQDTERNSTIHYQLEQGRLTASIPESFGSDAFPLEYQLGSGQHAVTLMTLIPGGNGENTVGVEHRASLFTAQHGLALTPGQSGKAVTQDVEAFGRIVRGDDLQRCFNCHTTTCEIRDQKLLNLRGNVGCENCHGAGSAHIAVARSLNQFPDADLRLTMPDAEAEIQLCGTCHRSLDGGNTKVVAREDWTLVRFQPVGLTQSRCYLESQSTLTCSTCHDPHQHASRRSHSEYEAICLSCHLTSPQRSADPEVTTLITCPVSPAGDCIGCHMPLVEVHQGVAFHDHWIRVRGDDDPPAFMNAATPHSSPNTLPTVPTAVGVTAPPSEPASTNVYKTSFRDVTAKTGFDFQHFSPLTEQRHLHLVMGSGIGWIDFDRDNWPDLFCAQGASYDDDKTSRVSDSLFRNRDGKTFEEVSTFAGIHDVEYSMGMAVGDFDNDGFSDLFVSHFGPNRLYFNNGDGTFSETAEVLQVDDDRYGASCTWVDLNSDGNLDLFVTNYMHLDKPHYPLCIEEYQGRRYPVICPPWKASAEMDAIYLSQGDGTFRDFTGDSTLTLSPAHHGLGVGVADFDENGHTDIYVANDSVANQLWLNQGDGVLSEQGLSSGTALNRNGRREAGMGLAIGDLDGDGRFDLFVTNYYGESNTFYRNEGDGLFLDVTDEFGLAGPSHTRLAFGATLLDVDSDGWLDLFVANGHVHDRLSDLGRDEPFAQRPQLFLNEGGRRMRLAAKSTASYFRQNVVGRGSATADFDRDGRPDLAVLHLNSQATLLHNESSGGNTLQIRLIGTNSNRDAIGTVVEVELPDRRIVRLRNGSTSYLSSDDGLLLIGTGDAQQVGNVTVRWPGGHLEKWDNLLVSRQHVLIEGTGKETVRKLPDR